MKNFLFIIFISLSCYGNIFSQATINYEIRPSSAQTNLDSAKSNIEKIQSETDSLNTELNTAKTISSNAQTNLDSAKSNIEKIQSETDSSNAEEALIEIKKEIAEFYKISLIPNTTTKDTIVKISPFKLKLIITINDSIEKTKHNIYLRKVNYTSTISWKDKKRSEKIILPGNNVNYYFDSSIVLNFSSNLIDNKIKLLDTFSPPFILENKKIDNDVTYTGEISYPTIYSSRQKTRYKQKIRSKYRRRSSVYLGFNLSPSWSNRTLLINDTELNDNGPITKRNSNDKADFNLQYNYQLGFFYNNRHVFYLEWINRPNRHFKTANGIDSTGLVNNQEELNYSSQNNHAFGINYRYSGYSTTRKFNPVFDLGFFVAPAKNSRTTIASKIGIGINYRPVRSLELRLVPTYYQDLRSEINSASINTFFNDLSLNLGIGLYFYRR